jgi:hypothetical protein
VRSRLLLRPLLKGRQPGLELVCGECADIGVDHLCDLDRLTGRDLALGYGLSQSSSSLGGIGSRVDGRQIERDWPVLAGREDAVEAQAQGDSISGKSYIHSLPCECIDLAVEERFGSECRLVARALLPAGLPG